MSFAVATGQQVLSRQLAWILLILLSGALVTGCSSSQQGRVPVVDRAHVTQSRPAQPVTQGSYVVRPGDTLYSIAFRFGWDWKELARRNNISAPYTIRPQQRIHFSRTTMATAQQRPTTGQAQSSKPAVVASSTKPAKTQASTQPAKTVATPVKSTAKSSTTATKSGSAAKPAASKSTGWRWPASGSIVAKFSSNTSLNKGIDIAGKAGQPVVAANKGTVVYAGSGLRGYGELVIIKHDDVYISAYGHNRALLVKEGQQVNAGQQIAEMGSTGTDQNKLHFEIRRQGKPVDPLQYLPAR